MDNGDFYLAENANALHYNIIEFLENKNILKFGDKDNYFETYPDNFVAVVRAGGTNGFGQSSAYDDFPIHYQQIFDNAESIYPFKFKKYKFDV